MERVRCVSLSMVSETRDKECGRCEMCVSQLFPGSHKWQVNGVTHEGLACCKDVDSSSMPSAQPVQAPCEAESGHVASNLPGKGRTDKPYNIMPQSQASPLPVYCASESTTCKLLLAEEQICPRPARCTVKRLCDSGLGKDRVKGPSNLRI